MEVASEVRWEEIRDARPGRRSGRVLKGGLERMVVSHRRALAWGCFGGGGLLLGVLSCNVAARCKHSNQQASERALRSKPAARTTDTADTNPHSLLQPTSIPLPALDLLL